MTNRFFVDVNEVLLPIRLVPEAEIDQAGKAFVGVPVIGYWNGEALRVFPEPADRWRVYRLMPVPLASRQGGRRVK